MFNIMIDRCGIPVIVITGGPCSGKTTGIPFLVEKLFDMGWYPIVVPESATLLMAGNVSPISGFFKEDDFQTSVIGMTIALEEQFIKSARSALHKRPVLICDRGIMDALAYTKPDVFWGVCSSFGLDVSTARDRRYDGVIHLRTAALGAEEFYTSANNPHRRETLEEARVQDCKTLEAWTGYSPVSIIGNEGVDFSQKLQRMLRAVCNILGVPAPLEIEEKYLIQPIDLGRVGIHHTVVDIEQVYLVEPSGFEGEVRVRKRGQGGCFTYYETRKQPMSRGVRIETNKFISADEYEWALRYQKPDTVPVRKKRHCFEYKNQYFELDVLDSPHKYKGLHLLEVECTEENSNIEIPPFVDVVRCVTEEEEFSNAFLARVA